MANRQGRFTRYLANNIPWSKITHINYAFAHVGADNRISVGPAGAGNASTGMEWPGVPGAEMDLSLSYKGHFNLLTKYKKQHPGVKTPISIGGQAETGGFLNPDGSRTASRSPTRSSDSCGSTVSTAPTSTTSTPHRPTTPEP
ncbi:glycosyl hydrolase family 18 protein [Kibdelosporangium philippinense]|uniref:Glycosyl hydrolase family 18 protein n=1 Tax=Kibdelosporangium philippinense TaxID=211113 RepID=A0ABS8YZV3_9PSEU|nr:glycosyl hydrolase family 18 protein [Kibdelosporangium philippinense]MCE7001261.1 glycosyl hydrolase family 18 protein [Kibdelosporangium philippinense]